MDALVADSARFDVFRLVDAALNGQPAQVSRMIAGLRAEGEAIPALMGMVVKELQHRRRAGARRAISPPSARRSASGRPSRPCTSARCRGIRRSAGSGCWWKPVRVDRIAKGRVRPGRESHDAWLQLERLLLAVADPGALRLLAS